MMVHSRGARAGSSKMKPGLVLLILTFSGCLATGQSLPYQQNGENCKNDTTEYYVGGIDHCCSKCPPGTRKSKDCTTASDTTCEKCQEGTYSEGFNFYQNCFRCSQCDDVKGLQYMKKCSTDSDAVCVCKPGFYCLFSDDSSCTECKKYRTCPPGKGVKAPGTYNKDIVCGTCPVGTFSNTTDGQPCNPHTRCENSGNVEIKPGTHKTDTVCGIVNKPKNLSSNMTTQKTTFTSTPTEPSTISFLAPNATGVIMSTTPQLSFTRIPQEKFTHYWIGLAAAAAVLGLVLLMMVTFMICHRKENVKPTDCGVSETKNGLEPPHFCSPSECQCLLTDNKTDQSTTSSCDGHSQSTAASQDCLHSEHPTVSSPCVNVRFTATFNCQLNAASGSCSIPISPTVQQQQQQQQEPELPLSQEEELCMSCQQEDGKAAVQSVQESMSVY